MPSVGTTAVSVGSGPILIQNLGDDDLYVLDEPSVTADTGVQLITGQSVAVGDGESFYVISEGTSDVRVLGHGTGIFAPASS